MARSFFSRVTGVALVVLLFGGASVSVAQTPIQVPNATFPMDSLPIGIAHDGTSLWVLDYVMDVMQQRSPTTGALVKSFPLGRVIPGAGDVAADGSGHLFITGAYPSTAFRMDVATGTISSLFQAPEVSRADGIAWDGTNFYLNGADDGTTFVYDSNGALVKSISAWARPRGMSYDKQRHTLWSVDYWSGAIQEVTTQGQLLRTCETGLPYLVTGIAIMNGSAYVSIAGPKTSVTFPPETRRGAASASARVS